MSELPFSSPPDEQTVSFAAWLREATRLLEEARVDSPRLSAELILRHVCEVSKPALIAYPERKLIPAQLSRMQGLLRRRAEGEPMAYLLGQREFFSRMFRVTPATLIPRPETEILVELALAAFPESDRTIRFADFGTGSGCIAVTLCAERPLWQGLAVERSSKALNIACRNAVRHKVSNQIQPVLADFTVPFLQEESLDLVVSNPPYVGLTEYAELSPEIRDFEPVTALVPGFVDSDRVHGHTHHAPRKISEEPEGLEALKAVATAAGVALRPGGLLLIEHGWQQGSVFRMWLKNHDWFQIRQHTDLAGLDRVIAARRP